MMVVVHFIAVKRNMPRDEPVPRGEWGGLILRGALPLSMPIVLLGGIYSGVFTPTEAAAVAALHALVLSAFVFRALTWRSFWGVVLESTRSSAVITIILAGSFVLNYAFTAEGVPQQFFFANGHGEHTYAATGTVYRGEFTNSKLNGSGTLTMTDGSEFRGDFKNDLATGRLTHADGTVEEGIFLFENAP
jgi:hypothetical protein